MVLEWTLDLKRLAYSRIDIFSAAAASVYISREHAQNHQTFCVSLVLVSFTLSNLQSCMSIISETLHDQSFSHI